MTVRCFMNLKKPQKTVKEISYTKYISHITTKTHQTRLCPLFSNLPMDYFSITSLIQQSRHIVLPNQKRATDLHANNLL